MSTIVAGGPGKPSHTLSVELADNPIRRARGLMGRASWADADGMLFVYPWPRVTGIWMAGTDLALDALFVDSAGRVVKIAPDLVPRSRHAEYSGARVKWVLEVPAGTCNRLGLAVGDRIEVATTSGMRGFLNWLTSWSGRSTRSG